MPAQPINLAEIQEWLCDCSKTIEGEESQAKFAEAARVVERARQALIRADKIVMGQVTQATLELIGPEILSPEAIAEATARRGENGDDKLTRKHNRRSRWWTWH